MWNETQSQKLKNKPKFQSQKLKIKSKIKFTLKFIFRFRLVWDVLYRHLVEGRRVANRQFMQTVILRERHTFCGHSVSSFVLFCVSFTSYNLNVSISLKFTFIVLIFNVSNSGLSFPDFCTGTEKATPTFLIMILIL